MSKKKLLRQFFDALYKYFGPQHWWPGESPFEIMVGAVLTQNTNWKNVERAIRNLKDSGLLTPQRIYNMPLAVLTRHIKSVGYYNVKAKRLKNLIKWFVEDYQADIARLKQEPLSKLREELLQIKGIGEETADSILLYALEYPTFVVDAYTYRVLNRHGIVPEETTYAEMKEIFEANLEPDVKLFNEYHALLVAVGKKFCKKKPVCKGCPLEKFLS